MKIIQDTDKAISIMHEVGVWLQKSGLHPSKWWNPENMNRSFLLNYVEPNEFFVAQMDNKPVASMVLQESQRNQSWESVDGANSPKAIYVHWLCVRRDSAGKGLSKIMIDFAAKEAAKRGFKLLRLDTDADNEKLCDLYETLGFHLMGTEVGKSHKTAFYSRPC